MNVEFITREDLNVLKQEIIEALKQPENTNSKKYLRSAEVRKMLKISAGTLQNMRINGSLPYSKIGTTIFYDLDKIIEIFNENSSDSSS